MVEKHLTKLLVTVLKHCYGSSVTKTYQKDFCGRELLEYLMCYIYV